MQRSTAVTESKVHPRVHERTEVDPVIRLIRMIAEFHTEAPNPAENEKSRGDVDSGSADPVEADVAEMKGHKEGVTD